MSLPDKIRERLEVEAERRYDYVSPLKPTPEECFSAGAEALWTILQEESPEFDEAALQAWFVNQDQYPAAKDIARWQFEQDKAALVAARAEIKALIDRAEDRMHQLAENERLRVALQFECGNRCAAQNPCSAREALERKA